MVKIVEYDNIEMKYLVFGDGSRPMVILPGLSIQDVCDQAEAIEAAYADFGRDHTVYLFERRSNPPENYRVRDMAEDTAAVMNALGIENADVFGASQGGMIAQFVAIDHPELVHRMVLGSAISRNNETVDKVSGHWLALAREGRKEELAASMVDSMCSETTLRLYRDVMIKANSEVSDSLLARYILMSEACRDFNAYDELDRIICPVLVIGSLGDRVVTAKGPKEIADKLGCASYFYDESYGHAVYDEAPDYRDRIAAFFRAEHL